MVQTQPLGDDEEDLNEISMLLFGPGNSTALHFEEPNFEPNVHVDVNYVKGDIVHVDVMSREILSMLILCQER